MTLSGRGVSANAPFKISNLSEPFLPRWNPRGVMLDHHGLAVAQQFRDISHRDPWAFQQDPRQRVTESVWRRFVLPRPAEAPESFQLPAPLISDGVQVFRVVLTEDQRTNLKAPA